MTAYNAPDFEVSVSRYRRLDEQAADASPLLNFTSREEYLAWVAAWRIALVESIIDVRRQKDIRRDKTLSDYDRFRAAEERNNLRVYGSNLFALRAAGKRRAAAQVQAQRMAKKAAA